MKFVSRLASEMKWFVTLSFILSACASTTPLSVPSEHAAFCDIAKPIGWNKQDTDRTIIAIKAHNAVGMKFCGWGMMP